MLRFVGIIMEYKLEDIFDLQMGKTPSRSNPEYWNSNDHKWISIGDLSRCGKYIEDTKEYLSDKAVEESGISIIPAGTVVMSFKLSIGKTAIIPEPMYSNEAIMSFRDKHVIDILPDYTYYMLSSRDWDTGTNKAVMGKTLNKATLSKIKVKVHGIAEQKEIVRVLDKLNAVIEARQMEIQKLEDLIKARFVEMFRNMNPSWPTVSIGDICTDARTGPFGSALHHDEFVNDGIFVLGIDNAVENRFSFNRMRYITEEKYQQLKRYTVYPGDVIITIMGTVGRSAVIPNDMPLAINTKHLACLTPDYAKVDSIFLCSAFQMHPDVQRQLNSNTKGAIMDGLNLGIIKGLEFQLPPLQKQKDFEFFYSQVDKSKCDALNITSAPHYLLAS